MKRKLILLIPVIILGLGIASMFILSAMKSDQPKRMMQQRSKTVDAEIVDLRSIPVHINAFGRVTSSQPIQLYSEVAGIILNGDIPFQPAQSFSRSDLILKIDDRQARLALNSAKSDLLTALATVLPEIKTDFPDEYNIWQGYFNNCGFDKKLKPLPETHSQKVKLFLSRFNVHKIYFSIRDLEIRLEKHYFYAPFDGSIVSTSLRTGSTARIGNLLGEIINLEQMEVEVQVPVVDVQLIDANGSVKLTSTEMPGQWTGRISRIGKVIDSRTQSVQVFISVDKHQKFPQFEGVFLEADIPGKSIDNAFSIPRKAVYNERNVYLVSNGKLEYREVRVAREETESIIINGGLENGDTLVVEMLQGIAPGTPAEALLISSGLENSK